jgi:predicted nuclease of predicted toxin-antitoxin system
MRFLLDEHFSPVIAIGLRKRRIESLSVYECGLVQSPDPDVLSFALSRRSVILTCDADYLVLHAAGAAHFGIVYWTASNSDVGRVLHWLGLLNEVYEEDELASRVLFLP